MTDTQKTHILQTVYSAISVLCDVAVTVISAFIYKNGCNCFHCSAIIIAGIICLLHAISNISELVSEKAVAPRLLKTFKFAICSFFGMSLITRHTSLIPYFFYSARDCLGYSAFSADKMLYICAFLVIVSFLFFDKKHRLSMHTIHFAALSSFVPAMIYATTEGEITPFYAVIYLLVTYILCFLLAVFNGNRLNAVFSLIKLASGK